MTLPILSNVFADNELVNEASLYARIFTPINTIYSLLLGITPQISTGTVTILSGTSSITGTVTFGTAFAVAPSAVQCQVTASSNVAVTVTAVTATNFSVRAFATSGNNVGANTAVPFTYVAFP